MNWQMVSAIVAAGMCALNLLALYRNVVVSRKSGEDAASAARKAHSRIDNLTDRLSSFETTVARDYASNAALTQMEGRVVDAINRLGDRLDRWADGEGQRRRQRTTT